MISPQRFYNRLFSNNDIFRHLLELTELDKDHQTLIMLFGEQGIEICSHRIRIWSLPLNHAQAKPIPARIFICFMNLLSAIKNEAREKEIFIFDLQGILEETRQELIN